MKLRARLLTTLVAVTLPSLGALVWLHRVDQRREAYAALSAYAETRLAHWSLRCRDDPRGFGGIDRGGPPAPPPFDRRALDGESSAPSPNDAPFGPPPAGPPPPRDPPPSDADHAPASVFAYDASGVPTRADAPALPARLAASLHDHDHDHDYDRAPVVDRLWWPTRDVALLVRAEPRSPRCDRFLVLGTTDLRWGGVLPASPLWLAPLALVVGAVLLSLGALVRRITALARAVETNVSTDYASEIGAHGDDELGALAASFAAAGQRVRSELAENARRTDALREFLANTTHDVMIPLTVLRGHLALLRESADAQLPTPSATVTAAMDEAHYLGALIENLALAARLDADEFRLERSPVDLVELVGRVVQRHRPIARARDVSLESAVPAEPLVVDADWTLLEQAASNLVGNAIAYNRAGGHVAVVLEDDDGEAFELRIVDDGPGIDDAELAAVQQRGARGSSAARSRAHGQGLGLDIASRSAQLHGYTLRFDRAAEGGLAVSLRGPRRRADVERG